MAARRAQILARSIPAIELLGATGTVRRQDRHADGNRMEVLGLWTEQAEFDGRQPASELPEALHGLLEYAVLASHRQAFDPMEQAITAAGTRWLANTEHLHRDWQLIDDYPLSRQLLAMSRVWLSPDHSAYLVAAKGAPEAIIDLCHLDAARSAAISAQVGIMAERGLRVIAVASATFAAPPLPDNQHVFEFGFLGLVALQDPIRPEVPPAVAQCHAAGMQVVMITGDHPATATAIATQAGIHGAVLSGSELASLDDQALSLRLQDCRVFCRIAPEQKLRLVQAFRQRGEIVAMTGDGVNDAPALKAAHIGVAMGARGTDVAREAAALVLLKDDFPRCCRRCAWPPPVRQSAQGHRVRRRRARAHCRPVLPARAVWLAAAADAGAHTVPAAGDRSGLRAGVRGGSHRGGRHAEPPRNPRLHRCSTAATCCAAACCKAARCCWCCCCAMPLRYAGWPKQVRAAPPS
jgi:Ca2+-transporting ATPase